jgi:hypothetical protein
MRVIHPCGVQPSLHTVFLFSIVLSSSGLFAPSLHAADPIGSLDSVSHGAISGWAYDSDAGATPIFVQIYIDNIYRGQVKADGYRPGIREVLPEVQGDYHSYEYELPGMVPGTHCVKAYAIDYPSGDRFALPSPPLVSECFSVNKGTAYLDNGIIRVGVDLDWGGAITEIIYKGNNLVNKHDEGRMIQINLMDGKDKDFYDPLDMSSSNMGYSPNQAGDKYQHYSSVLKQIITDNFIYTRTQPLEWNPDNKGGGKTKSVASDVYVDQWIYLNGPLVKVKYVLTHIGNDRHEYFNQLIPYVFVNKDFRRLITYAGNNPWEGDGKLTEAAPPEFPDALNLSPSEGWAALVNDNDFGITVYTTPHLSLWAAQRGTAYNCNSLYPLTVTDIPPGEVIEITADLIIGKFQEARSMIYELHEKETPLTYWEFNQNNNRGGWIPWNGMTPFNVSGGTLKTNSTGVDPHMVMSQELGIDSRKYPTIEISMKVEAGGVGQFFFTTLSDQVYDEKKSKTFIINTGKDFVTYRLDMSTMSTWAGIISQMRFDPTNAPGKIEIDYIRILPKGRSSIDISLASGETGEANTVGGSSPLQAGYAVTNVTSGDAPYATAVFGFSQNGVTVSEAGVPASPPTTSARVFIDYRSRVSAAPGKNGAGFIDINTGIAVVNYGSATANAIYTLRDVTGAVFATGNGTVPAHSHFAKFVDQLNEVASDFHLPSDFAKSVQFASLDIASDQPISIVALRMATSQRNEALFTTTPIADLTQSLSTDSISFPQFADGGGYTTSLVLLNTSDATETGKMEIFDDKGSPLSVNPVGGISNASFQYSIPPGGAFRFQTDGSPINARAGWVQLTPDRGSKTPIGSGLFSYNPGSVLVSESGIPSAPSATHVRVYIDLSKNHTTGLAIANIADTDSSITVNAFQSDGITSAGISGGPLQLSAKAHVAMFADQFIAGLPPEFVGVLDIRSSKPFAALALRSLVNEREDFLMTTFPVANVDKPAPSPIVFPQIVDGGGYVTEFILISPGGASKATVGFFDNNGMPLAAGR